MILFAPVDFKYEIEGIWGMKLIDELIKYVVSVQSWINNSLKGLSKMGSVLYFSWYFKNWKCL